MFFFYNNGIVAEKPTLTICTGACFTNATHFVNTHNDQRQKPYHLQVHFASAARFSIYGQYVCNRHSNGHVYTMEHRLLKGMESLSTLFIKRGLLNHAVNTSEKSRKC